MKLILLVVRKPTRTRTTIFVDKRIGNSGSPVLQQRDMASIGAHVYGGAINSASVIGVYGNLYPDYEAAFDMKLTTVHTPGLTSTDGVKYVRVPTTAKNTSATTTAKDAGLLDKRIFDNAWDRATKFSAPLQSGHRDRPSALKMIGPHTAALTSIAIATAKAYAENKYATLSGSELQREMAASGVAERAIVAEAAFSAILKIGAEPLKAMGFKKKMSKMIVNDYGAVQKIAPHLMGAVTEPALRICLDLLTKENRGGEEANFGQVLETLHISRNRRPRSTEAAVAQSPEVAETFTKDLKFVEFLMMKRRQREQKNAKVSGEDAYESIFSAAIKRIPWKTIVTHVVGGLVTAAAQEGYQGESGEYNLESLSNLALGIPDENAGPEFYFSPTNLANHYWVAHLKNMAVKEKAEMTVNGDSGAEFFPWQASAVISSGNNAKSIFPDRSAEITVNDGAASNISDEDSGAEFTFRQNMYDSLIRYIDGPMSKKRDLRAEAALSVLMKASGERLRLREQGKKQKSESIVTDNGVEEESGAEFFTWALQIAQAKQKQAQKNAETTTNDNEDDSAAESFLPWAAYHMLVREREEKKKRKAETTVSGSGVEKLEHVEENEQAEGSFPWSAYRAMMEKQKKGMAEAIVNEAAVTSEAETFSGAPERAVLGQAALAAVMQLPPDQLGEGFWDTFLDTVEDIGPSVLRAASAIYTNVKPVYTKLRVKQELRRSPK